MVGTVTTPNGRPQIVNSSVDEKKKKQQASPTFGQVLSKIVLFDILSFMSNIVGVINNQRYCNKVIKLDIQDHVNDVICIHKLASRLLCFPNLLCQMSRSTHITPCLPFVTRCKLFVYQTCYNIVAILLIRYGFAIIIREIL